MGNETTDFHQARQEVSERFDRLIASDIMLTSLTYAQIAAIYGLEEKYVQRLAVKNNIRRPRGVASPAYKRKGKAVGK